MKVTFMKRLDPSNRDAFALGPNTLQMTCYCKVTTLFQAGDGQQLILKVASIQNYNLDRPNTCNATSALI